MAFVKSVPTTKPTSLPMVGLLLFVCMGIFSMIQVSRTLFSFQSYYTGSHSTSDSLWETGDAGKEVGLRRLDSAKSFQSISVVAISERGTDAKGETLKGLVHSLLKHTSSPVHFHYVSSQKYRWLEQLDRPPHFSVMWHSPKPLLNAAKSTLKKTGFKLAPNVPISTMSKLYLPLLEYPEQPEKVWVLDTDIILYNDLAPLARLFARNLHPLTLSCTIDASMAQSRNSKYPNNGSPTDHCGSGIMGMQLQEGLMKVFEQTASDMMSDYPDFESEHPDDDIINRVFRNHNHEIPIIPCSWKCEYATCHNHSNAENGFQCSNCGYSSGVGAGDAVNCRAFHFGGHHRTYIPLGNNTLSWPAYKDLNSGTLFGDFMARLS